MRRGTIARVTDRPAAPQHLRDLALLRRVRDRIDREYAQPLDVEALARTAHMSAGHLSRQFKLAYGESPYSYLMTRRIERAMTLLRRGDLSVTEVCFAVGSRRYALGDTPTSSVNRVLNVPSDEQPTSKHTSVTLRSPRRSSAIARSMRRVMR